ncbi:hypothetical protein KM043_010121 [Ampulex compressa]|nr:hypothetical protein KM043_010121 [Ampulex compressa]
MNPGSAPLAENFRGKLLPSDQESGFARETDEPPIEQYPPWPKVQVSRSLALEAGYRFPYRETPSLLQSISVEHHLQAGYKLPYPTAPSWPQKCPIAQSSKQDTSLAIQQHPPGSKSRSVQYLNPRSRIQTPLSNSTSFNPKQKCRTPLL